MVNSGIEFHLNPH